MADTLKFRGLSTVQIDTDSVATREIVIDLDTNQLAIGGTGGTFSFYNTAQVDEIISRIVGAEGNADDAIDDLTDVNIDQSNLVYGDVLSWNGTNWVNSGVDISRSTLDNLSGVNITTPVALGDYLSWNGLEWVNYEAPSVENLSDSLLTVLTDKQSLIWNGTEWTNSYLSIDDAFDVNIGTTGLYQSLNWSGSEWVNSYIPLNAASDVIISSQQANQSLVWTGSEWVNSYLTISDTTDVDTSGATAGQRLEYNGTNWVAVPNDADTLDGLDSLQFLRSDAGDIKNSGDLRFDDNIKLNLGTNTDGSLYSDNTNINLDLNAGATSFIIRNGTTPSFTFNKSGDLTVTGDVSADTFTGDGSSITDLNASNINAGEIGDAYLPDTISSDITGNAASVTVASNAGNNDKYLLFVNSTTDSTGTVLYNPAIKLNAATEKLTATKFQGNGEQLTDLDASNINAGEIGDAYLPDSISSDITGNAATASQVFLNGSAGVDFDWRVLLGDGTGNKAVFNDGQLTFNSSTNVLTSDSFSGNLTGNVTGNVTGSSGSCTGNAATASVATNVALTTASADTLTYVTFVANETAADLPLKRSLALTYNSSTGRLNATKFGGDGSSITNLDYNNISNPPAASITNLGVSRTGSAVTVTCSTGNDAVINEATSSDAGVMTTTQHDKLDGIEAGAEVNVGTNLSNSTGGGSVTIESSTGNNTTISAATTSAAGVMSSTMKSKLDGIADNATNVTNNTQITNGAGYVTASDTVAAADTIKVGATTNTNPRYLAFVNGTSGYIQAQVATSITATPSSGKITATTFAGDLTGTADKADEINVNLSTTSNSRRLLFANGSGYLPAQCSTALTVIPSTGTITATTFVGNLDGNATSADTVDVAGTGTDTNYRVTLSDGTGAGKPLLSDGGLLYNPSSNILTCSGEFSGPLSWSNVTNKPTLFSGSYTDLTNKPTIYDEPGIFRNGGNPTLATGVTAQEVRNLIGAGTSSFSGSYSDLTNKPTLFSGSYTDLTNKPTIPADTNDLTNGAGYITSTGTAAVAEVAEEVSITAGATLEDTTCYPTFVRGLGSPLPLYTKGTLYFNSKNGKLFATEFSGSGASLTSIPYSALTNTPTIPTATGDLTNNSGFITSSGSITGSSGSCTGTSTGVSAGASTADITSSTFIRIYSTETGSPAGAYRFGKPNNNNREGLFDFSNIGAGDRTYTWQASNGTVAFTNGSDRRLKKNIADITSQAALDFVNNVEPVTFCWRNGEGSGVEHCHDHSAGYIAQQVSAAGYDYMLDTTPMTVDDEAKGNYYTHDRSEVDAETGVSNPDDAYYTMNYEMVTPFLHKALADALDKIDELQARLDAAGL